MNLDELREYAGFKNQTSDFDPKNSFDIWNKEKKNLNQKTNFPHPKRRQIWWFVIGQNLGQEQSCADGFERPVLILKVFGNIFWGLPITSSDKDKKKENNPLYIKLDGMEYRDEQGEKRVLHGFIAIHQLRAFDCRRLIRNLVRLDELTFNSIIEKVRSKIT